MINMMAAGFGSLLSSHLSTIIWALSQQQQHGSCTHYPGKDGMYAVIRSGGFQLMGGQFNFYGY